VTLTLITDIRIAIKLPLDISYLDTKFGDNRPKEAENEFIILAMTLNIKHLGSNPKLPLDISYTPSLASKGQKQTSFLATAILTLITGTWLAISRRVLI
jgi:hypothetical protein